MKTDPVSSALPPPKEVAAKNNSFTGKDGDAFAALLQEIFSARMSSLQFENIRDKAAVQSGEDLEGKLTEPFLQEMPPVSAQTTESPPALQDSNKDALFDFAGSKKIELLDRLIAELGEEKENTLVLIPWLLSALFSGQAMSPENEPSLEIQLERLYQLLEEMFSAQGEEGLPFSDFIKMAAPGLALQPEELLEMENKLLSGEVPLLDEKGFLTAEAGSVISSYLQGEELREKFQSAFPELSKEMKAEQSLVFSGNGESELEENVSLTPEKLIVAGKQLPPSRESFSALTPQANVQSAGSLRENLLPLPEERYPGVSDGLKENRNGEVLFSRVQPETVQVKPPASLLDRLEQFLRSFLLGERVATGGQSPGEVSGEGISTDTAFRKADELAKPGNGGEFIFTSGSRTEETAFLRQAAYRDNLFQSREIITQIVDKLAFLARPGEQELRMKLQPEFLGEILIRMRRARGILSAEIITQNIAVKELLEGQMDILRQRFQQLDMNVEEFRILVNDEQNQNGGSGGKGREQQRESDSVLSMASAYGKVDEPVFEGYGENRRVNFLA